MLLFTRTVRMSGPLQDVASYAADMRALVSDKTGVDVGLWSVQFGAPLGTMVYSARVEDMVHLSSIQTTLMADADYHKHLAKGSDFVAGPAEDALGEPLHGGEGDAPPVGTVVTATRAVIAGGAYSEAIAWSVDMASGDVLSTANVDTATATVPGVPALTLNWGAHGATTNRVWFWSSPWVIPADYPLGDTTVRVAYKTDEGKVGVYDYKITVNP